MLFYAFFCFCDIVVVGWLRALRLAAEGLLPVVLEPVEVLWLEVQNAPSLWLAAEGHLAEVVPTVHVLWLELEDVLALWPAAEDHHAEMFGTAPALWLEFQGVLALALAVTYPRLDVGFLLDLLGG